MPKNPVYLWDSGPVISGQDGWHDLRHFHASTLIASGMSPRAVAERLGHADASETLKTYAHLWPSDHARMADAADAALGMLRPGDATVIPLRRSERA